LKQSAETVLAVPSRTISASRERTASAHSHEPTLSRTSEQFSKQLDALSVAFRELNAIR